MSEITDVVGVINSAIKAGNKEVTVRLRSTGLVLGIKIAGDDVQAYVGENHMYVKLSSGDEVQLHERDAELIINGKDVLAELRKKHPVTVSLKEIRQIFGANDYINIVIYLRPRKQGGADQGMGGDEECWAERECMRRCEGECKNDPWCVNECVNECIAIECGEKYADY